MFSASTEDIVKLVVSRPPSNPEKPAQSRRSQSVPLRLHALDAVREEDDRHVRSFMKLERALFKRFPFLDSTSIGSAWAGAYLQTGTEAPIVGTVPGHPNVILSIGYGGGSGVGTALMSGKLTADLATEDRMDSDAERMRTLFASGMRWPIGGFLRAGLSILKGMISGSI